MCKFVIGSILFFVSLNGHALLLGDANNGQRIHEAKCAACHKGHFEGDGSAIYTRKDRRIQTIEGLMAQVEFCNTQTRSNLNDDEINDLVKYLHDNFYKFE